MKLLLSIFFFASCFVSAFATHNRAGEITYRHIEGLKFEFTVTTYTYIKSNANRNALEVNWGDGTTSIIELIQGGRTELPNDYYRNIYKGVHTFPGAGVYEILMEDPNRNLGVNNIPNSVNVVFSIKTTMLIGAYSGTNTTPALLNPPIDKAARGHIFIHNPAAYDADGDSLSYELTICTGAEGLPIDGYVLPPATDTLKVDPVRGNLLWITPQDTGVYNIAMYVDEWRDGTRIGRIARDMQIDVYNTENSPPVNSPVQNFCVVAGDTVEFLVSSTDADNDFIKIEMVGGPLSYGSSPAEFNVDSTAMGISWGSFKWVTNCEYARKQPHAVIFKSEDINDDIQLVDLTDINITVVHTPVEGVRVTPSTDNVTVEWLASQCGSPEGYHIYRRTGSSGFVPDSCEIGVPAYTGYQRIASVKGAGRTSYNDDNNELGLVPGFDYCYMVTAYYADGAESLASNEACTPLIAGTPPMLKVSVEVHNAVNGEIHLAWAFPVGVDTVDDGPYRYEISRIDPGSDAFNVIHTINTIDLLDTNYVDANLNTEIFPYVYTVKLYYEEGGSWIEMPGNEIASSMVLEINGSDNTIHVETIKRAPWLNTEYFIFRQREGDVAFDSLGMFTEPLFVDSGLENGVNYTYRVEAVGERPLFEKDYYTYNISHLNTGAAIDTIPPCSPELTGSSVCDSSYNQLNWTNPMLECGDDDVVGYRLYYKPRLEGDFTLLQEFDDPNQLSYQHRPSESLAAVYALTAVDSFMNESPILPLILDECDYYYLPNAFSPNGDGNGDIYTSDNIGGFITTVEMQIFNRYGQLVYDTTDPDINWDGNDNKTGKVVSSGVYFYLCNVVEIRISGEVEKSLTGFIHVFAGDTNESQVLD